MSVPARLIPLPAAAPRTGTAPGRWLGRTVLALGRWRMTGAFPDRTHLVIIVAPHSSAWDAVWGLAAKLALGLDVRFLAKAELFRGPLGWLLGGLGGIPINRSRAAGAVETAAARFAASPRLWLVIAPEGTRRRVERWKTGFWRIARAAGVPVLCAWFHYPERTIGIGPLLETSDDLDADMARIRAVFAPHRGKHRGTV
ncbi:MAG TPA: 1-acyl-sn-glycerol-3-phosphate acyltransferase [Xanthomonadaceae bacterium]|nr:1-acyl-sn-glycerol-3-phosphate acyltransferase [Xanthomonadaceae bacterium]